ncbi:M56 family metallopeptidase [Singulisphaera acidiphila]|uniref:Antirepressor regulating drug resistance protein n=1 Tax=Singulisphaera acidiphila (strain ATCC BAA-1392 / DSM 18658 / VKM B-2454 / MOB10) TaxID=886293 RepID=L0DQH3_SINAD|nr:M56 family metallopeptidase [Singulisphaera acidiphila]AGA31155.1 antirepressor regulating drug resistance protein [Singulisphaera acidiphila DSM 18658]
MMRPAWDSFWFWLADYYVLATFILLAAVVVLAALRQPARRLTVSWSVLGGLVTLLVLGAVPSWPRTGLPSPLSPVQPRHVPTETVSAEPPFPREEEPNSAMPRSEALTTSGKPQRDRLAKPAPPMRSPEMVPQARPIRSWPWLVCRAFLAGGGLMVGWLVLGSWQTARLRRQARAAPAWSTALLAQVVGPDHRVPKLLVCTALRQPVAAGILRPAILLPERFSEDAPENRLEAVLTHEWAHIRNRDLWLLALLRLLLPILYAHPAYWWLRRRIRDDQEALADASAAALEGRENYAEVLLSWSKQASDGPRFAAGGSLALFERPSQIKWRIVMLLDRSLRIEPTCPTWWRLAVRGGMALSVLGLSLVTLRPATSQADAPRIADITTTKPAPAEPNDRPGETARVFGLDGKPFAGAKVYHSSTFARRPRPTPPSPVGTTREDGSFTIPKAAKPGNAHNESIVAMADGYGPAFVALPEAVAGKPLNLVKDDVPIHGRILDIQGQPVVGASIQLVGLLQHPSGKLDEWIETVKTRKAALPVQYETLLSWMTTEIPSLFPAVLTDDSGRFTLKGIGRERIASLLISGPGIKTGFTYAATRRMPVLKFPAFEHQDARTPLIVYHGENFDFVADPGIEAIGTVTDQDSGKPLAGVMVETAELIGDHQLRSLWTATDEQGQYRLSGIAPKTRFNDSQKLLASIDDGPPYLAAAKSIGKEDGSKPIRRDFQLKRGVWVHGKVVDTSTGKGVHAGIAYYIMDDNPYLKKYPQYDTIYATPANQTDADGTFKLIVMPGQGIIGARAWKDSYRLGSGLEKLEELKLKNDGGEIIRARPSHLIPTNYHTIVAINPGEGDESITCEIPLDPGRTVKGTIVGPDGAPLVGARLEGTEDQFRRWSAKPLPSANFEARALGSGQSRLILFYHEEKKLAGARVIGPDETGPIVVQLEPSGTVTGRLVDAGGLPLAEAEMSCFVSYDDPTHKTGSLPAPVKTDKEGRFRAEGLIPGQSYRFQLWKGSELRETPINAVITRGETKDLGDVSIITNK